jgi:Fic family protein
MATSEFAPYRITKETVRRPRRDRFAPRYEVDQEIHDALRNIERNDQELRRFGLDGVESRRLWRQALARNAFGTASIEGNPLTLEDVESLLVASPSPASITEPDEREILNHAAMMQRLPTLKVPRSLHEVSALHADLFEGVMADAGDFKKQRNFIGRRQDRSVIYVPSEPARVEPELHNALDWLHDASEHPLVRVIIFFHEYQAIHPFRDGNGRSGRLLSTIATYQFGYPGIRYALVDYSFNADRNGYYEALAATQRSDWDYTPWLRYMTRMLDTTFREALDRFLFSGDLPKGLNDRQIRVAEWFAGASKAHEGRLVKFNVVHQAFPDTPRRTLQLDLAVLSEAGVIEKRGERKGTTYAFERRHGAGKKEVSG